MGWVPKQKIVVPVDFSDESIAAVDVALELVDSPANIQVVHVLPVLTAMEPGVVWEAADDESRRDHAIEALRERLADAKYQGLNLDVSFGDPGREIADFAESKAADLIVLPSHGRTGLSHLLIGSVAERVVRLSHCPVLVLRQ